MKQETRLWILLALMVVGIVLMLWGIHLMYAYELHEFTGTYKEALKEARQVAKLQIFGGLIMMIVAYIFTFVKPKK